MFHFMVKKLDTVKSAAINLKNENLGDLALFKIRKLVGSLKFGAISWLLMMKIALHSKNTFTETEPLDFHDEVPRMKLSLFRRKG